MDLKWETRADDRAYWRRTSHRSIANIGGREDRTTKEPRMIHRHCSMCVQCVGRICRSASTATDALTEHKRSVREGLLERERERVRERGRAQANMQKHFSQPRDKPATDLVTGHSVVAVQYPLYATGLGAYLWQDILRGFWRGQHQDLACMHTHIALHNVNKFLIIKIMLLMFVKRILLNFRSMRCTIQIWIQNKIKI